MTGAPSVKDLLRMDAAQIAALYARAATPSLQELDGDYDGTLLRAQILPLRRTIGLAAVNRPWLPWKGKVFFRTPGARGKGGNRWATWRSARTIWPFETAVVPSRFGGGPALLVDYDVPGNPLWLRRGVFDELKKLDDGLYLGMGGIGPGGAGPRRAIAFSWALTRA